MGGSHNIHVQGSSKRKEKGRLISLNQQSNSAVGLMQSHSQSVDLIDHKHSGQFKPNTYTGRGSSGSTDLQYASANVNLAIGHN